MGLYTAVDKKADQTSMNRRTRRLFFVKSKYRRAYYICCMKKLISIAYTDFSFNLATFILRVAMGVLMIPHGYDKLVNFAKYKGDFMNFLGLGPTLSLALVVFAEFFCSVFLILGLFTRVVVVVLAIAMLVAIFKAHNGDIFGDGEHGSLFLAGYLAILLIGPGKASLDGILGK